jgi:hypothetical protein
MVDDETLLARREELTRKKAELSKIQIPKVTRRELQLGMESRPRRLELRRFSRAVQSQKKSYGEQIKAIDRYLEEKNKIREPSDPIPILTYPKISLFQKPRPTKMKKRKRRYWLNGI